MPRSNAAAARPDIVRLADSRWSVVRAFIRALDALPVSAWLAALGAADEAEMNEMLAALAKAQDAVASEGLVMAHRQLRSAVALAARAAAARAEAPDDRREISAAAVLAEWSALALLVRPYLQRTTFLALYLPFRDPLDPDTLELAASSQRARTLSERDDGDAEHHERH